jgi:L-cysteine:1D-myo-inositol 2-amino-2-deoxy-alpha-D-glucopyranoside ligase
MRLFDTRRGDYDTFVPGRTVRIYVCGITPYDSTHLGHAFTYTAFDALIRYLEHLGHDVRYVRNVTDVDDDILRKSREIEEPVDVLARREVARLHTDLEALGARSPDAEPWVTDAVPAIIWAVKGLLLKGHAYALDDGRVYFDTEAASGDFGALSHLSRDEMLVQFGENGGDPDAKGKRDVLDFLLWQPSLPDEPGWDTPFSPVPGRPGWHIECSVMASEELGSTIDIHGGGRDLVFPHHEAEILQAEYLSGQRPFARFWLHSGMVGLDGEKMSKSLGNLVFVSDLLERYEPIAIRRYLLSNHYRSDWSFDERAMADAATAAKRWEEAAVGAGEDESLRAAFHEAMANDLDTPEAVAILDKMAVRGAGTTLRRCAHVLGFDLEQHFQKESR